MEPFQLAVVCSYTLFYDKWRLSSLAHCGRMFLASLRWKLTMWQFVNPFWFLLNWKHPDNVFKVLPLPKFRSERGILERLGDSRARTGQGLPLGEAYDWKKKKGVTTGARDHCAPLSVNTVPFKMTAFPFLFSFNTQVSTFFYEPGL